MIAHFQYIGDPSISGHVTSGLNILSHMPRCVLYFGVTSYRPKSNTLYGRIYSEDDNKVVLHDVLFMQATGKMTTNLNVVPKMYTGFVNARFGNVKHTSQYDFANVVKHIS